MKVIIDHHLCTGHGRCYMLAPDVFGFDGEGYSVLQRDELPSTLEAQASTAERNCPEGAIRLVRSVEGASCEVTLPGPLTS